MSQVPSHLTHRLGIEIHDYLYVIYLVIILAIIDTVLSHLKQLEDGNHIHILTWNIMKYGFCYFFIGYYHFIVLKVLEGFVKVGLVAGGGIVTVNEFTDPSYVISLGHALGAPMRQTLLNTSVASLPMSAMQSQLASVQLGTELSFVIIAIQIFITYLEFYIVGALAIVFIPFLASSHTRFLGDKVMPAIMGAGAKLMVLAFIMSATIPYLVRSQARAADIVTQMLDSNSGESIETLATSLAIAFLCWQGPSMASSLMAGIGSSSSASSAQTASKGMSDGAAMGGGSVGAGAAEAMKNVQEKMGGMLGKATGGDKGH